MDDRGEPLVRALLGLFLLAGSGCSAHEACVDALPYDAPKNLTTDTLAGSATLTGKGESTTLSLSVNVSELPKLWQSDGNLANGIVSVSFAPTYDGSVRGDDGATEMPRISSTLGVVGLPQGLTYSTSAFPSGSIAPPPLHLFDSCGSPDFDGPDCCPFGARECSVPVQLTLTRQDGPPFPPVVLSYAVDAAASASSCPFEANSKVKMTLSQESP